MGDGSEQDFFKEEVGCSREQGQPVVARHACVSITSIITIKKSLKGARCGRVPRVDGIFCQKIPREFMCQF